ncbi:hypothetical protein DWUX_2076 [Desulfovibrio diazotrophicus]|nr:hypothetical protein DWUX_2076 [Desulfovibrio diazotrophicus]
MRARFDGACSGRGGVTGRRGARAFCARPSGMPINNIFFV